jgi:hypothetical protein
MGKPHQMLVLSFGARIAEKRTPNGAPNCGRYGGAQSEFLELSGAPPGQQRRIRKNQFSALPST